MSTEITEHDCCLFVLEDQVGLFSSVTHSCPTLCDPMDCSMPGLPVHHQLLEFTQTHVHWVSDAIQPSHPLSSPSPPGFNLSQQQGLFNEAVLCIRWPTYWSFSVSISPSNEYSGLISLRIDWLDPLAAQGTLKSLLQHHSSKASILLCSALFIVQLSYLYMTTGKNIALTTWTFVDKVISLLFNMLSRLVLTFLPRSKHLLISWLQSHLQWFWSPQNSRPGVLQVMGSQRVGHDWATELNWTEKQSVTVYIVSPTICHEVMGLDAMILVFWMLRFLVFFSNQLFTLLFHLHQEAL